MVDDLLLAATEGVVTEDPAQHLRGVTQAGTGDGGGHLSHFTSNPRRDAGRRFCPAGSPQVPADEHVDERHERDQHEHGPGHLRARGYVGAGQQVDPDEDDRERMEEAEEKLDDLLHVPNLLDCGLAWSLRRTGAPMPTDVLNLRALNRALLARQML